MASRFPRFESLKIMARTKNPELVATARNIARSVPDRIVAVTFLDDRDGRNPELVDPGDGETTLTGSELDGQEPTRPAKPSPSS